MEHTDVLVVGAGPTGLTLACELLRHGVRCIVIDELAEPVIFSKAAAVHVRTMEIFQVMGVANAILEHTRVFHGFSIHADQKRVGHVVLEGVASRFPYAYGVSQRDTEGVLTERLTSLGGRIVRSTKLESFTQDDSGVVAKTSSGTIGARYIVGCDGAHSTVRKACGFTFEGAPYEERIIQADVHVDWPKRTDDDEVHAFLHPGGPLALFPLFKDGRYRLIVFFLPGEPEVEPTLENFQRFLDERGPEGAVARDPAWMVAFRIHHRMTNRYRDRRAFVAGDAAHIHSPAGGQGMNTGIQDAFNLAWKLSLVVRNKAKPELLDSYEAERMPVARELLAATDAATKGVGTVGGLRHPIAIGLRNQLLGFVTKLDAFRARVGRTVSMIEIGYRESPIVAQDRVPLVRANVLSSTSSEHPSLADWAAFGEGPSPGDRATDLPMGDGRLFDLFSTGRHVALLFDGAAATEAGNENLERISASLTKRWPDLIDVHAIVPRENKPESLSHCNVVLDVDGAIHKAYGARSECLYLVRPDGYIAYRGQPADGAALEAYLKTILS